ncbi:Berberine bridge enzyme-like 18 [Citrus sinensis]|uniref:Berberine bridge enzyme-like 18 n=1 Tax=Citrus sinensis TaxID=2711 RepID=A0ACB8K971_CITSI|nr:Berberine bridge enzyme-like 18 [Citrus sinensis]
MKRHGLFCPNIISFVSFLLLLFHGAALAPENHENFLKCLSLQSDTISKVIYTQNNSSYSSVLTSSIQNLVFSAPTNQKPLFIITPFHVSEIQAAIKCSKKSGLQIRVRSGGHDLEGLSSISDVPFIIVDLINFSEISIDAEAKTAWVQSGATVGQLNYRIAEKSQNLLAFPVGTCPGVAVGGHFSGGGYGALLRKYGVAADHIVDAHMIDARGRFLNRESMGEDLFWAIRGGGGPSFGIIISWKIELVDVPSTVTVFAIPRTLEQNATKLLHKWQYIADRVHEDLFISPFLYRANSTMVCLFTSLFLGGVDRLLPLMQESFPELGLTQEDCREMSFIESVVYINGFEIRESVNANILIDDRFIKRFFKGKADYVIEPIPKEAFEGLYDLFYEEDPRTYGLLVFFPYGGKMREISESEIPFPHRAGNRYTLLYYTEWQDATNEASQRHKNMLNKLFNYMTPYVAKNPRTAYINYRDLDIGTNNKLGDTSVQEASVWGKKYFKNNFYRLVHVKTMVDPENFFRNEQSIPPFNLLKDEL